MRQIGKVGGSQQQGGDTRRRVSRHPRTAPNVAVLRGKHGIEVLHLASGEEVCRSPLTGAALYVQHPAGTAVPVCRLPPSFARWPCAFSD